MLADVVERIELLQHGEDSFVTSILGRIPPTPPNHALIVQLNEAGLVPELADTIDLEAGATAVLFPEPARGPRAPIRGRA